MTLFDRVFRRRRLYDDLHDEIRAHIDEHVDYLVGRGVPRADAIAQAKRAFGNVTSIEERGRDTWQWPTIESFAMDVRFALRQLRRTPALAIIIVLTLAVGVAATATVFSWTRAILIDPLPGTVDANRVLALESTTASGSWTPVSWLDYRDFRKYLKSFDGIAATMPASLALGVGPRAERGRGELVSANFFDVLGVRPALGHFFAPSLDDADGAQPAVVISNGLWRSRWHGDSAVLGRTIEIDRFPFTIVGVAPPSFRGSLPAEDVQLWVPASMLGQIMPTDGWQLHDRGTREFRVLARLAPDVTVPAARAEVRRFGTYMSAVNAGSSKGMSANLLPIWQSHYGVHDGLRAPLLVLLGACGLVLLIVCANMAGLLIARATGRRRELSMRLALGAPRRRLVRQLLTEAAILATAGSALGLLCTMWLARSLHVLVPSFAVPSLLQPSVDGGVLAFTLLLACGVTLLAGVAPALHGSREHFNDSLGDSGRGAAGGVHATRARSMLVVAEMALALVSLVGAGLFFDSDRQTRAVPPGFDASPVAMGSVSLTLSGYDSSFADNFLQRVIERLRSAPGVTAASYTDYVPLSVGQGSWEDLQVEGYAPEPNENMKLYRAAIGPDYFKTLGIPLVTGRDFRADDDSAHAPVMIVNEAFVRHFLHGRAALGVRVHGWGRWFTIVGVAKDTKVYRLTEPPTPYFYVPVRQVYRPEYGYTFLVRTAAPVDQAARAIASTVAALDPTVPVFDDMPLAAYEQAPLQEQQMAAELLALLAGVAALLAAIGLYGVIAFAVTQRSKEIGVRIALGATAARVVRVVAVQAGALLAGGLIAGLVVAAAMGRVVSSMLFSVGAGNLAVFGSSVAALIVVSIAAVLVPARRAARLDPVIALRAD